MYQLEIICIRSIAKPKLKANSVKPKLKYKTKPNQSQILTQKPFLYAFIFMNVV